MSSFSPIEVLYECPSFIAVNKPSGVLVHPVRINGVIRPEETIVGMIHDRYPSIATVGDDPATRPGIVHRLDRETSGVLLIALTQEGFSHLKEQFQQHTIVKTYITLLSGSMRPPNGSIHLPIGIKSGTIKRSVFSKKMVKSAQTWYETQEEFGAFSLVKASPRTGRTHQLRVHFSAQGHPIIGDDVYGRRSDPLRGCRLMLHALSIEVSSLMGERVHIEAPLPADFLDILHRARLL